MSDALRPGGLVGIVLRSTANSEGHAMRGLPSELSFGVDSLRKAFVSLSRVRRVKRSLCLYQEQMSLLEKVHATTKDRDLSGVLQLHVRLQTLEIQSCGRLKSETRYQSLLAATPFIRDHVLQSCSKDLRGPGLANTLSSLPSLVFLKLHDITLVIRKMIIEHVKGRFHPAFVSETVKENSIRADISPLHILYSTIRDVLMSTQAASEQPVEIGMFGAVDEQESDAILISIHNDMYEVWVSSIEYFLSWFEKLCLKRTQGPSSSESKQYLAQLDAIIEDIILITRVCKAQHLMFIKYWPVKGYTDTCQEIQVESDCLESIPTLNNVIHLCCEFEGIYMQESVSKIVSDGDIDSRVVLDDIFFLVSRSIRRSFALMSTHYVSVLVEKIHSLLSDIMNHYVKKRMGIHPHEVVACFPDDMEELEQASGNSNERESCLLPLLIAPLNDASTMENRISGLQQDIISLTRNMFKEKTDQEHILQAAEQLCNLSAATCGWRRNYVLSLVRTRLATLSAAMECFAGGAYVVSDTDYATRYGFNTWETDISNILLKDFAIVSIIFDASNAELYVRSTCEGLVTRLENIVITRLTFNHLGALKLERELRRIFSSISGSIPFHVRGSFSRLVQLSAVLSAENTDEVESYVSDMRCQSSWKLTAHDVQNIMALRVDFRVGDNKINSM